MNYLAHVFLADDTAESLIGNLAGDFVKGPLGDRFPPAIAAGIRNHRRIDAFTDTHPAVAAFRHVLIPEHGHYARVIADVFFDHFLAMNWNEYSGEPLEAFLRRVFTTMDTQIALMPERLAAVYPRMRDGRWFLSYRTLDGIHTALFHLSKRLSRQPQLETATRHLIDSRAELERLFREFLPEVVAFAGE
jgi:acyl carrier protein phosphodiesterase